MRAFKLSYAEFVDIYSKVTRICVDLVVKADEGIVLVKRDIPPALGMWHFPGGTILIDETIADTIKRIAQDEIGLQVEVVALLGVIEYYNLDYTVVRSISLAYQVKPISGNLTGSPEGQEVAYFKTPPPNTIPEVVAFLSSLKKH
jgi:colanic acid biosynthesis protein WcaH